MKKSKLLLVFLLILLCRFNSTAQESASQFSYGLHLGSSFSGFTNNYEVFSLIKTGFTGGLFVEYKPAPVIGISLDVAYLMEGAFHVDPLLIYPQSSISYPGGSVYRYASDITLYNLHAPLMINFRPVKTGVSPTISLGYFFDYMLGAHSQDMIMASGTTSQIPVSERSSTNVSTSFEKWNMGPIAGVGITFPAEKYNISFDVRYKVGTWNINTQGGSTVQNGLYNFSVNTLLFYLTISK
jgi:hypothetical protein